MISQLHRSIFSNSQAIKLQSLPVVVQVNKDTSKLIICCLEVMIRNKLFTLGNLTKMCFSAQTCNTFWNKHRVLYLEQLQPRTLLYHICTKDACSFNYAPDCPILHRPHLRPLYFVPVFCCPFMASVEVSCCL